MAATKVANGTGSGGGAGPANGASGGGGGGAQGGAETAEARDEQVEGALLDAMGAAIKKLIARGKERGYVTVDELNAALPSEQVSSEMIEDTMAMLSEAGINVVEAEETEDGEAAKPVAKAEGEEE